MNSCLQRANKHFIKKKDSKTNLKDAQIVEEQRKVKETIIAEITITKNKA
jgi:hypothetical protein